MEFSQNQTKQSQIAAIMRDSALNSTEKQKFVADILSNHKDTNEVPKKEKLACTHYVKQCDNFEFQCCNEIDHCHRYLILNCRIYAIFDFILKFI